MVNIGKISLHKPPNIVLSISDTEANEDIVRFKVAVLELRVDKFRKHDPEYVLEQITLRRQTGIPLLLTIRTQEEEGGDGSMSDEQKWVIFERCIKDVDAVDVELSSPIRDKLIDLARNSQKTVIVSSHNFEKTPELFELERILVESLEVGGDIVKIAAWAQGEEDMALLGKFTQENRDKNVATISLGEIGSLSRITFSEAGSLLTYSFFGESMAPGQMPVDVLQEKLNEHFSDFREERL